MFAWIFENIATIIICIVLFAVVTAIIVSMVRGKKKENPPVDADVLIVQ